MFSLCQIEQRKFQQISTFSVSCYRQPGPLFKDTRCLSSYRDFQTNAGQASVLEQYLCIKLLTGALNPTCGRWSWKDLPFLYSITSCIWRIGTLDMLLPRVLLISTSCSSFSCLHPYSLTSLQFVFARSFLFFWWKGAHKLSPNQGRGNRQAERRML